MSTLKANTITEQTSGAGVLVEDGVLDFTGASKGKFKGVESIVWRMINTESSGSQVPLGGSGSDWEIADDTLPENFLGASISSIVTEGSGIFSFVSTGYWQVRFYGHALGSAVDNVVYMVGQHTADASAGVLATWTAGAQPVCNVGGSGWRASVAGEMLLKITDIAEQKVRFIQNCATAAFQGDSSTNLTYAVFTKIADL